MVKFVILKLLSESYYTSKGKIWAYYPINSHDPQIFYLLIKLFKDKSCDFTIQVNFFAFAVNFSKKSIKNHSWRFELKEGLILVANQTFAIKKSVKLSILILKQNEKFRKF